VPLVVQKFGGSSVANAERLQKAARRAVAAKEAGYQVIVVVSARGDSTDDLIELSRELTTTPSSREMDMLLATGEQISIALLAMAIQELGHDAVSLTGPQAGIRTDRTHCKARIRHINTDRIRRELDAGHIVIVAGFQGQDDAGEITTLGRGGSDTTAVALASAIKHAGNGRYADTQCEIYTDVDGVYTTDPRIVPEARKVPSISYEEMLELTSLGAGVMHSRSIEFASKFGVPFQVRNSFSDAPGTWIVPEAAWTRHTPVCGVALVREEARVRLAGLPDQPGISHRIFSTLAERKIVVDMIAQSIGKMGKAEIGFTVLQGDLTTTLDLLRPLAQELGATVTHVDSVSKVSIVGAGMRTHTGVAASMFNALADAHINIRLITTSEIKITVLVDKRDGVRALKTVHEAFGLHVLKLPDEATPPKLPPAPAGPTPDHPLTSCPATAPLDDMEAIVVSSVVIDETQGRISIFDFPDQPGNCGKVFSAIALAGVNVDLIVQSSDDNGVTELSFTVPRQDMGRAYETVQLSLQKINASSRASADSEIAKVMIYGAGIRSNTGVVQKMFGALAARGITLDLISTSEICVSVVVHRRHGPTAVDALREAFGLK
jgi:aspartate kinase